MWAIYKANVLRAMASGRFSKDPDSFADFIANEYDKAIKSGGDILYGVFVINGNKKGFADVVKRALKKGQSMDGENFNILQEIYPAAFDAYWMGAEMAPFPNPLMKPAGWQGTPPAPGAVMNIGPNPISLAASAAKHAALVAAISALEDQLKGTTVDIPGLGPTDIYQTATDILKNKPVDEKVKKHPAILAAKEIIRMVKDAKSKKPSIGSQMKKSIKFPFPKLPSKKKLMEAAKKKLKDEATKLIKKQLEDAAKEVILNTAAAAIMVQLQAITLANGVSASSVVSQDKVKQYLSDKIDGKQTNLLPATPTTPGAPTPPAIPEIKEPKIPTKQEITQMIQEKIPSDAEISGIAEGAIQGKIPQIPNVFFIPPTLLFSPKTNTFIDPFVNVAKLHLLGTGGTMSVLAQYPPPAPPAPAVLFWNGYTVRNGPPVPPIPAPFPVIPPMPTLPTA